MLSVRKVAAAINNIVLSEIDRAVLESYKNVMDGLSDYYGDGYEFVLHSLEDLNHSVVKIINGHYTGRAEGAPITDLALSMLAKIQENGPAQYTSYFCNNKKGEPIKAATIAIQGENQRVIGLLCINLYLDTSFLSFIKNFTSDSESRYISQSEHFAENIHEVIEKAVTQARGEVRSNSKISVSNRNKEIIYRLCERGIFHLKDSVVTVADLLKISKNTVYLHLRNYSN